MIIFLLYVYIYIYMLILVLIIIRYSEEGTESFYKVSVWRAVFPVIAA